MPEPTAVMTFGLAATTGYEVAGQYQGVTAEMWGQFKGAMESVYSREFRRKRFEAFITKRDRTDRFLAKDEQGDYTHTVTYEEWVVWDAAFTFILNGE